VKTLQNQVLVPSSTVQHNGEKAFVFLIQKDAKGQLHAKQQSVKTGISNNNETAVEGINPGDVVANSSFEKLQNGSQVFISKTAIPSTSEESESSAP
jgi:multidrug efflux system membrane fusion protein